MVSIADYQKGALFIVFADRKYPDYLIYIKSKGWLFKFTDQCILKTGLITDTNDFIIFISMIESILIHKFSFSYSRLT